MAGFKSHTENAAGKSPAIRVWQVVLASILAGFLFLCVFSVVGLPSWHLPGRLEYSFGASQILEGPTEVRLYCQIDAIRHRNHPAASPSYARRTIAQYLFVIPKGNGEIQKHLIPTAATFHSNRIKLFIVRGRTLALDRNRPELAYLYEVSTSGWSEADARKGRFPEFLQGLGLEKYRSKPYSEVKSALQDEMTKSGWKLIGDNPHSPAGDEPWPIFEHTGMIEITMDHPEWRIDVTRTREGRRVVSTILDSIADRDEYARVPADLR